MKISFNIDYRTNWGESVYLVGSCAALGGGDPQKAVKLSLDGDEHWSVNVNIPRTVKQIEYRYFVKHDNGAEKREWGPMHRLVFSSADTYDIYDRWQDMPKDKPYYSSAFTECICHRAIREVNAAPAAGSITFCVAAPMVKPDQVVAISGASAALGAWDTKKAVVLTDEFFPLWSANVPVAEDMAKGSEFKFLILDKASGSVVAWEGGDNRRLGFTPAKDAASVSAGMRFINLQTPWRGAGTAIPVFSLRSEQDFGVGDFYDLMPMVDWVAATGQNIIQLLPINDTTMTGTWTDSYPYNANSTYALHPMYLRITDLGTLHDAERQRYFDDLGKELNQLTEVDYERVNRGKAEFVKEIFAQEGKKVLASVEYKNFFKRNQAWLTPYAAFCVLRDRFGTAEFSQWGEYAVYDPDKIAEFVAKNTTYINQVYYVQYNLDRQMRAVRDYAHSKGVAIKGDIPIGISRTSADAWLNPRLFNLDCQAGAPPDDFSVLGQNWGLPTYNWEEMNRDGFAWWKDRFRKMSEYFDAYRIDHVLGFFRIWQIPMDAIHGLLGYFSPALPFSADELRDSYDFWIDVDRHTTPFIMDYFLHDFFGEYTDEARVRFLEPAGYGRYRLKDEFSTQRKVAEYFGKAEKDEKNTRLCNALLGLIDDVLFLPDPEQPGKFHPRISAQFTYIYRSLNDYERWCFNRLYNDFFYHRHNDFWYGKAMWKLPPLIDATDMLVCAEDLGMIPACVPAVMDALEILSLEIQRMPKDPKTEFGNTWSYPYFSVCTTSTHDMDGIRAWWEADRKKTQDYYNHVLAQGGEAPYFAEPWICDRILDLHLKSPSMLCIIPLQDWLSMDGAIRRENPAEELINVPANPRHYWRYRMHLTLEDLATEEAFNSHLRSMILSSGR